MSTTQGVAPGEAQPFYTPKTLARRLALSDRSVRRLLAEGALTSYLVGGVRRIDPVDVDRYLQSRRDN